MACGGQGPSAFPSHCPAPSCAMWHRPRYQPEGLPSWCCSKEIVLCLGGCGPCLSGGQASLFLPPAAPRPLPFPLLWIGGSLHGAESPHSPVSNSLCLGSCPAGSPSAWLLLPSSVLPALSAADPYQAAGVSGQLPCSLAASPASVGFQLMELTAALQPSPLLAFFSLSSYKILT